MYLDYSVSDLPAVQAQTVHVCSPWSPTKAEPRPRRTPSNQTKPNGKPRLDDCCNSDPSEDASSGFKNRSTERHPSKEEPRNTRGEHSAKDRATNYADDRQIPQILPRGCAGHKSELDPEGDRSKHGPAQDAEATESDGDSDYAPKRCWLHQVQSRSNEQV